MSTQPVTSAASAPEGSHSAYDNLGKAPKSQRKSRNTPETIPATPDQQISVELQVINAQNATQQGIIKTAQATSDVLASQTLALTQNLTAMKVVTQMASIFEGDNNVTEVATAFLFGTPQSGYQIADAIANLGSSQPLLLQAIAPKQLTAA
jgi:vacuolar-type H+-ATPase subunit I/STV1